VDTALEGRRHATGLADMRTQPDKPQSRLMHLIGFLVSGGVAFGTDAAVLEVLLKVTTWPPIACRLIAIPCAMVVGWRMHRRHTFTVQTASTWREFRDFAAVGWSAALVNYLIFAGLVLAFPTMLPFAALVVSSIVAMIFSYLGYRFHVFR
jgi:putative flippase GtrA